MLFAYFRPVPGKGQGRKAALVPAQLGVAFPRWIWRWVRKERPGSPGRSAAGCGGRGCLPVMSHAGALQDAAECGSRGDAEQNGKKGRAGGNGDNCPIQAQMKGSGLQGEVVHWSSVGSL